MRHLTMMLIHQKRQSMCKKCWEDILLKQCMEEVNADSDEIDITSDDSDLEDNDHIEAI